MNIMNLFRRLFGIETPDGAAPVAPAPIEPQRSVNAPRTPRVDIRNAVAHAAQRRKGRCMIVGCGAHIVTRGVCCMHYDLARKAIKAGEITERQAIESRLILPSSINTTRRIQWEPVGFEADAPKKPVCIWNECGRPVHHRGACWRHYKEVRESILDGQFTEREAVDAKMIAPGVDGHSKIGWTRRDRRSHPEAGS